MPTPLTGNNGAPADSSVVAPQATTAQSLVSSADVLTAAPNSQPVALAAPTTNSNTPGHIPGASSAASEPERLAGPVHNVVADAAVIDPQLLELGVVVPGPQSPPPQANLLVTVQALQGQSA